MKKLLILILLNGQIYTVDDWSEKQPKKGEKPPIFNQKQIKLGLFLGTYFSSVMIYAYLRRRNRLKTIQNMNITPDDPLFWRAGIMI